MQVVDAQSKGGFELQDKTGAKVVATKDVVGAEKWLQFIPLAISLGAQVYDALSKEGALPPKSSYGCRRTFRRRQRRAGST
jgi:hypothetical protein